MDVKEACKIILGEESESESEEPKKHKEEVPTLYVYDEETESYYAVDQVSPFIEDYYYLDEEEGAFTVYEAPVEAPVLYAFSEESESFYEVSEPSLVKGAFYYWDEDSATYSIMNSPVFNEFYGEGELDKEYFERRTAELEAKEIEEDPEVVAAREAAEEKAIKEEIDAFFE